MLVCAKFDPIQFVHKSLAAAAKQYLVKAKGEVTLWWASRDACVFANPDPCGPGKLPFARAAVVSVGRVPLRVKIFYSHSFRGALELPPASECEERRPEPRTRQAVCGVPKLRARFTRNLPSRLPYAVA